MNLKKATNELYQIADTQAACDARRQVAEALDGRLDRQACSDAQVACREEYAELRFRDHVPAEAHRALAEILYALVYGIPMANAEETALFAIGDAAFTACQRIGMPTIVCAAAQDAACVFCQ